MCFAFRNAEAAIKGRGVNAEEKDYSYEKRTKQDSELQELWQTQSSKHLTLSFMSFNRWQYQKPLHTESRTDILICSAT